MSVTREELDVILRLFDDRRALIAAGKVQRWEVTKWVVTANFALAAAAATPSFGSVRGFLLILVGLIAGMGFVLLWHYNMRMTKVRGSLRNINRFLKEKVVDIEAVGADKFTTLKDADYDRQEMAIFYGASMLSFVPILVAAI